MLRYLHLCLSMQQRRWWTMSASNLLIFFFVLFWLEAIYVFFSWKSLLSYTLIKFLLFGAVHKWRQQFFEMFYPSLSLLSPILLTGLWNGVTSPFARSPSFPLSGWHHLWMVPYLHLVKQRQNELHDDEW